MVTYASWRRSLEGIQESVLRLVEETEAKLAQRADLGDLGRSYPDIGFSPRIWGVYLATAERLRGVKRIDGRPYTTHPTRMALSSQWVLAGSAAEDAGVAALLHDYLEEGGGINREGLDALRRRLPAERVDAAVLLSEPEIAYERLGRASELSLLRRVAYVVQVEDALANGAPRAFADAALLDKLDNLHDLGYLTRELYPERRARKLAQRAAFFKLTGEQVGAYATPTVREILESGLAAKIDEYGIGDEALAQHVVLKQSLETHREAIRRMIAGFHAQVLAAPA